MMKTQMFRIVPVVCLALAAGASWAASTAPASVGGFHVDLAAGTPPSSGRVLIFIDEAKEAEQISHGKVTEIDADIMEVEHVTVMGKDVSQLVAGQGVDIYADAISYPEPISHLAP